MTLGLATKYHNLRLSRQLRLTRKVFAKLTGFHGLLSGKAYYGVRKDPAFADNFSKVENIYGFDFNGSAASVEQFNNSKGSSVSTTEDGLSEVEEEQRRLKRVQTIDKLIAEGQERLQQLICEKDVLQRRPNPLYSYNTQTDSLPGSKTGPRKVLNSIDQTASRQFKFPPDDLVDEYLEMIFWSRRLMKVIF